MYCPSCNAQITNDSNFCNICGYKIDATVSQIPVQRNKKSSGAMVLLVVLISIISTLFVIIGAVFGLKAYEKHNMSKIREFKATETNVDGYYLIEQDGYGNFYKFEVYDENDELISYREYKYNNDGQLKKQILYDAENDMPVLEVKYEYNKNGTRKKATNYYNNSVEHFTSTTYYVEKGKEHTLDSDIISYVVTEYDKYGRMIKGQNYYDGKLSSTWVDEYNKHGLVKETWWNEGDTTKYALKLKPLD